MDLPLLNFSFNINEDWRTLYKKKFELYIDTLNINADETLNIYFLIENWISTMFYNSMHNEVKTYTYDEYNVIYQFPRYKLQCHLTLYI